MKRNLLIGIVLLIGAIGFQLNFAQAEIVEPSTLVSVTGTNFLPTTLTAGGTGSMAVNVKSNAYAFTIPDLNGTIDLGNQFEPIKIQDSISNLQVGSTKTLIFNFQVKKNTLPGYYPVSLALAYERPDGSLGKQTQLISIGVSKSEKNLDVTVSPKVINPGNQTELVFTLKNLGGTSVSNIAFSWTESTSLILPIGSDNKRYVSLIEAEKEESVSYSIAADPNITPGIYPLNVSMSYNDENGTRTQTSQVGLIVGGTTDFEISAEINTNNQLSISIANIGSNNAGAVVVKIPEQTGIRVNGSSIAIIGNLNKGDYTIASFQLSTQTFATSSGTGRIQQGNQAGVGPGQQDSADQNAQVRTGQALNSVNVEISYTDTTGERQTEQKSVSLVRDTTGATTTGTFSGRTNQNSLSNILWIVLAIIIGAAVFLNHKTKAKNWKLLAIILVPIIILFAATILLLNSNLIAIAVSVAIAVVLLAWFFRKNKPGLSIAFPKKEK